MVRRALTLAQVNALKAQGTHRVAEKLYLQIKPNGARSWLYRYTVDGKTRWHGLGAERDVPLAEARESAENLRVDIRRHGIDPVADRKAKRSEQQATKASTVPSFKVCAEAYIAAHEAGWRNDRHIAQWRSSLANNVYPKIGAMAVNRIGVEDVLGVLKPMWTTTPETASRVRGRIESVLGWAKAMGHRDGENPASWRDALKHLLPARASVQKVTPRRAMPYRDLPALVPELRALDTIGAKALYLLLLTATRTAETLGATWDEVDLDEKLWVIPAERMKAGKEHRVPLSDEAVALLQSMPRKGKLIFPGHLKGRPLSKGTMVTVLRKLRPDHREDVHGLRSSFSDWAAEQTDYAREVVEASLAHEVGTAVERAYRRTDFLDRRRALMQEWARYCSPAP